MTFIHSSLTTVSDTSTQQSAGQMTNGKCHPLKHESILILDIASNQHHSPNDANINKTSPTLPSTANTQQLSTQQTKTKLYSCPNCQQSFSRPHNLKSHLATHSTDRPYQCDQCDAHFRRQHDLKRHQKLHSGERPFVCQVCSRSFARSDALNRHQRVDGDVRCSMAQRHCIIPFNVVPSQQTTASTTPASMTFSFPLDTSPSPQPTLLESPSRSPSPCISSPPMPRLPSPSALSTLPLSDNPNLSPLYKLPTDYSQHRLSVFPPSPSLLHHDKTLPALTAPASPRPIHIPSPKKYNDCKDQEIIRLKQEHERHMERLANQVHDLQVENKVLRSLVLQTNGLKRSRQASLDALFPNQNDDFAKKSRYSI